MGLFDIVVNSGNIVFPGRSVREGNIGISGGKIAAITGPEQRLDGKAVIEAGGKYIFPGVIEPHSHLGLGAGAEDLVTETRAAVLGGVTTVLFFLRQPLPYDEHYHEVKKMGEKNSFIDFSFHIVLLTEEHLKSIPRYINDFGITSFKFYLTYRGQDAKMGIFGGKIMEFAGVDNGFMLDCFTELSHFPRSVVIVHAEDSEIVNRCKKKLIEAGRDDLEAYALSRPVFAEVEGVRRALAFARKTGCRVNILHLTSADALEEVVGFRKVYDRVFVEVCHPYLVFNETDATSNMFKVRPPLRKPLDNEALWQGVKNGEVNTIGSDHVPRKLAEKLGSIWSPAAGAPGTPYLFPIMLSEGYHKRGIPLTKIAELLSLNPAMLYGMYPQKGDICVGSDADLVIVDLLREHVLKVSDFPSFSDYNLYEGLKVQGYPELTMVRGKIVAQDGRVKGPSGGGRFVGR
jgi:dihydropyrimidinase